MNKWRDFPNGDDPYPHATPPPSKASQPLFKYSSFKENLSIIHHLKFHFIIIIKKKKIPFHHLKFHPFVLLSIYFKHSFPGTQ